MSTASRVGQAEEEQIDVTIFLRVITGSQRREQVRSAKALVDFLLQSGTNKTWLVFNIPCS